MLSILWWFVTGQPISGRAKSDATFWRRATTAYDQPLRYFGPNRTSGWSMAPGWQHSAVRLLFPALMIGLWLGPEETELAVLAALVAGGAWLSLRWRHRMGWRRHVRQLEQPLAYALAPYLGAPGHVILAGLNVRRDYEDADAGEQLGSLTLPDSWAATPDQRRQVEHVIQARFGTELRYQWRTSAYPMHLNLTRAPLPPASVPFAAVRAEIEASPPQRVVLGRTAEGRLAYWDTGAEDPHLAIHGGSRRGKTSLLLLIAAQEVRKGARVVAIDPKRVGLLPLAGMGPAVELVTDLREVGRMWEAVGRFRELIEDRYDQLAADPTAEFPRALLIIDEVSQFAAMSAAHWRAVKERSDPAMPPVWGDVAAAVWMGAQCRAHVIVAGQRLDYVLLGGMLGSFGVRMLAGYQPADYMRLVGIPPVQRSQKRRGRFLLSAGGEVEWVQVAYGSPDELRGWVLEGRAESRDSALDLGAERPAGTRDTGELVGIAAAAAHLGMQPEAFRKARQRRPVPGETLGPDGRTPAWPASALTAWRADAPRAGNTRRGA